MNLARCEVQIRRQISVLRALGAVVLGLGVVAGCGAGTSKESREVADAVTVAAASDLRPAFEELGAAFTAETGIAVTLSFGSSGLLREQIINGAPFDLFASANVAFIDDVIAAGRGDADSIALYGRGRIVLWAQSGAVLPSGIEDLIDPRFRRIVIANPQHAPYGVAAAEALAAAGVADAVQNRLVYGENISDAMRIVESGNAEVGIIALSLAIAAGSDYQLIPDGLHEPLDQALVVISSGARGAAAQAFSEFIMSPDGQRVMNRYGFVAAEQ
jgi:molybdate transport system substrate-binding protein